jgi:hypothetical protein
MINNAVHYVHGREIRFSPWAVFAYNTPTNKEKRGPGMKREIDKSESSGG